MIQHDLKGKVVHLLEPGEPAKRGHRDTNSPYDLLGELRKRGMDRSKILYLCDTGGLNGDSIGEPMTLDCVTVLTAALGCCRRMHFLHVAQCWFWGTWTMQELLAARKDLFEEEMSQEKLVERSEQVGQSPPAGSIGRYVFGQNLDSRIQSPMYSMRGRDCRLRRCLIWRGTMRCNLLIC